MNASLLAWVCSVPNDTALKGYPTPWPGSSRGTGNRFRHRCPELQVLLNADENTADLGPDEYRAYIRKTCQNAIAASCCGINMNYRDCRSEFFEYARLRCLPVLLYTIDNETDMERFLKLGVHSITTHEVHTLLHLREQLNAPSRSKKLPSSPLNPD
jgi:glycerophosphoryl diester phosphodiesterase